MKMQNGMKRFFEERARYWYIVAAVFVVLGIADYGFLSIVIPLWACNIIMIVLIILATAYIAIMYNYSRQKCKACISCWKTDGCSNSRSSRADDLRCSKEPKGQ